MKKSLEQSKMCGEITWYGCVEAQAGVAPCLRPLGGGLMTKGDGKRCPETWVTIFNELPTWANMGR